VIQTGKTLVFIGVPRRVYLSSHTQNRWRMCFLFYLHFCAAVMLVAHAFPLPYDSAVDVVWSFPDGTWIENLAVRQNGQVLCTSLTAAALYLVDPFRHTTELIHQFDPDEDLLGVTEIENDIFAVVSANISFTTSTASPGSAKLWRVDIRAWERVSR
jgi:hypothetical protein